MKIEEYIDLNKTVEDFMENRFKKYDNVYKSFAKFFDLDELKDILKSKADIIFVNDLTMKKEKINID